MNNEQGKQLLSIPLLSPFPPSRSDAAPRVELRRRTGFVVRYSSDTGSCRNSVNPILVKICTDRQDTITAHHGGIIVPFGAFRLPCMVVELYLLPCSGQAALRPQQAVLVPIAVQIVFTAIFAAYEVDSTHP